MTPTAQKIDVYLEIGEKRTFAGAIDWPGWSRSGRDEQAALQALLEYGPRYAHVLRATGLAFQSPTDEAALNLVERLKGTMTTDFGAPDKAPSADARPVDDNELRQLQTILNACWQQFNETAKAAAGKELRKGPRGGGRELEKIVEHVLGADAAYLGQLGWKLVPGYSNDLNLLQQADRNALELAARLEEPGRGPRGGVRWGPRYFVRRAAWHILDHAWEIEDRVQTEKK